MIFWLALVALGHAAGTVELFILVGLAVVAVVLRTRKVLQTPSVPGVGR